MDLRGDGKKTMKKESDGLDDILGDLLSDSPPRKQKQNASASPLKQRAAGKAAKKAAKPGDDTFYSNLAALADSDAASDVSEADVGKMAYSLGGLDDMDADLFGDNLKRKSNTGRSSKPTTPRRSTTPRSKVVESGSPTRAQQSPTRSDTPTSPPGSARGSLKRKPVKPTLTSSASVTSPPIAKIDPKPGTAPGKLSDLGKASESLKPGQVHSQRPDTAPKLKSKYDYGDFDPDDPLAGVLSDDDVDDISESDRPKSAIKKPQPSKSPESKKKIVENTGVKLDSPRRRNLMDRPPTRSGSNAGDGPNVAEKNTAADPGQKVQHNIFSEDDSDLLDGLGLDKKEKAAPVSEAPKNRPPTGGSEENRPARSLFDSLLGKGSGTTASLLEPKEKKEFVLDSKYSSSVAGSAEGKDEDDLQFGSYQPSAASGSRPNSRRSVRFQDDDDIFGLDSRPSPRNKSPTSKGRGPPQDMEWLEMAAGKPPVPGADATHSARQSGQAVAALTAQTESATPNSPKKPASAMPLPKTNMSPRAWLGLDDSDTDGEELFKPKRSSARSATLPQSPAMSGSPRVPPKKLLKKEPSSPTVSGAVEGDDDDDWLARARNRRQQMLNKDNKSEDGIDAKSAHSELVEKEDTGGIDFQSLRMDLSSVVMDSPKQGIVSTTSLQGMTSSAPGRFPQGDSSARGLASNTMFGAGDAGQPIHPVPMTPPASDSRLRFSSSTFENKQPQTALEITPSSPAKMKPPPVPQFHHSAQSQQQQQYLKLQEEQNQHLLQTQQQLQQMLQNIQTQYQAQLPPPASSAMTVPSYKEMAATIQVPDSLPEVQARLCKVELEKKYTDALLDNTKRRYEEEMLAVETSYRNRLQIIEESNRKKESRLREDNEDLMQQHIVRVRQLEQEKGDMSTANFRKMEDWEVAKAQEIERVKELHRVAVSALKRDHEDALERIIQAKNKEIDMVANANDTSKSLTAVVEQIQTNARDLGQLHGKVESWNRQGLDEREISLRSKDEQLRILQERLNRQEDDNDRERKRLEELIARMETQLRDQTRTLEEERWKLKQDQSKVEAQQKAVEEERRLWLEQQARERVTMERSRETYLDEQRSSMAQISEERRSLTEDRTKFSVEQKEMRDKAHQSSFKHNQAEADYEMLMRTIAEEKSHHSLRMQELHCEEEKMTAVRDKLERDKRLLDDEREKLADQAHQIRQQSTQIDHMTESASRTRQEGEQAMDEAMMMSNMVEKREHEIVRQQQGLKIMEDHIAEEKLRLAKEKKEVENLKSSSLCTNCRSPVNGGYMHPAHLQNGFHPGHSTPNIMAVSPIHPHLMSSVPVQHSTNPLDHIASSIASDRAVRVLKIQAIKDKEFLEEESMYLESLRHTPYHSVSSKT